MADKEGGRERGHVPSLSNLEYSDLTGEIPKSDDLWDSVDKLHEFGKVKGLVGKLEEKEAHLDETASGMPVTQVDKKEDM